MIYLLLLLLLLFAHFGKTNNKQKRVVVFAIISLIACCGYMCGSDWRGYELQYYDLDEPLEYIKAGILEPGIYALMFLFKEIGFSYWGFSCILKTLCLIPIWTMIQRQADRDYFFLTILFYFSFYGFELFVDCPFRNLCAISICAISMIYYDKRLLFHLIVVSLAFLFHSSALIMIPFLFFMKKEIKTKYFVVIYCVVLVVSMTGDLLGYIAKVPLLDTLFLGEKVNRYAVNGFGDDSLIANPFSLSELLRTALFFWIVLNRKFFSKTGIENVVFNGAMFFFILSKFAIAVELLGRFSFFFAAYYSIAMVHLATKNYLEIRSLSYTMLVSLLSFVLCVSAVTADYRFIPYTNYLYYKVFVDPLPTYSERDNYNYINSPYAKKR